MKLIILAAGQGSRLRPLTDEKPKCLVEIGGKPLLEWQLDIAHAAGVKDKDICIVGGYKREKLLHYPIHLLENIHFENTNMLYSLFCAESYFEDDIIISYGDILYSADVLTRIIDNTDPISVVVDLSWRSYWQQRFENPLMDAESLKVNSAGEILQIGQKNNLLMDDIQGQYIGLLSFKNKGLEVLKNTYRDLWMKDSTVVRKMYMTDFLQYLVDSHHKVKMLPIHQSWFELDNLSDVNIAEARISNTWFNVSKIEA